MVAKDQPTPRNNGPSTPKGASYLKRFQQQRPSNIDALSPQSEATFDSPSYDEKQSTYYENQSTCYENQSYLFGNTPANGNAQTPASYRPQRPQMTPRRVLRNSPKSPAPVPSIHGARPKASAKIPRNIRIDHTGKPVGPLKNPKAVRSSTRQPPPQGVNARKSLPSPRKQTKKAAQKQSMLANFKKKGSKDKATPLLSNETRDESNSRKQGKTSRNGPYRPPGINTRQNTSETKEVRVPTQLSSPMAVANAKKKARAMGRREPPQMAQSMDSDINNDKYASSQKEDRYDSVYDSQESRGTFDETIGDTIDEELAPDETYSMDGKSLVTKTRSMLRLGWSGSISENSSFDSIMIKQKVAWGCIALSAIQFSILTTQVLLCGVASFDVNPTLGPYPDAFSEWGGKNAYLLVEDGQYFRLITPVFLHVGYLHLAVNGFFQLETCAYLEREWGFLQWIIIYLISGFGSCLAAAAIDPDGISVCSSGALMGLFGARLAQAILWTAFETNTEYIGQGQAIFERLTGIVCSAAGVFALTLLTFIDWSGHLGGLFTGVFAGIFVFAHAIHDSRIKNGLRILSSFALLFAGLWLAVLLFRFAQFDEELADACNYFRNLYVEGYECECEAFR